MREVDLGGRTVEVHYGAKAMRAIERECGCSWIKLADKAANDELLLQDIVVIVWGGLLKARRGVTVEQVADMLGDDLRTVYTVGNACMVAPVVVSTSATASPTPTPVIRLISFRNRSTESWKSCR